MLDRKGCLVLSSLLSSPVDFVDQLTGLYLSANRARHIWRSAENTVTKQFTRLASRSSEAETVGRAGARDHGERESHW